MLEDPDTAELAAAVVALEMAVAQDMTAVPGTERVVTEHYDLVDRCAAGTSPELDAMRDRDEDCFADVIHILDERSAAAGCCVGKYRAAGENRVVDEPGAVDGYCAVGCYEFADEKRAATHDLLHVCCHDWIE